MRRRRTSLRTALGALTVGGARFLAATAVAAVALVVLLLVLFVPVGGPSPRNLVVKTALVVISAGVLVNCWRTARRANGYNRRVWGLFTFTGLVWTVAQLHSLVEPHAPAGNGIAAVLSLGAMVPAVWALTNLPSEHRSRGERIRMWLGPAWWSRRRSCS